MIIGDPNRDLRIALSSQLGQIGFPAVPHTDSLESIIEAAENDAVDMLVCDPSLPGGDFHELIQNIRKSAIGTNPFIIVMALISEPDHNKVKRAAACGVDEILTKPISAGKVIERIVRLTKSRKKFVVTEDYIGPNRGLAIEQQADGEVREMDAPNPLKLLVNGGDLNEYMEQVESGRVVVNEKALAVDAGKIDVLVDRLMPLYSMGMVDESILDELRLLAMTALDITTRLDGTHEAHVADLCKSMHTIAKRMMLNPTDPEPKDLQLMPQVSKAISLAFSGNEREADIAREIARSLLGE